MRSGWCTGMRTKGTINTTQTGYSLVQGCSIPEEERPVVAFRPVCWPAGSPGVHAASLGHVMCGICKAVALAKGLPAPPAVGCAPCP